MQIITICIKYLFNYLFVLGNILKKIMLRLYLIENQHQNNTDKIMNLQ